jgi:hypothetical protein
VAIRGLPRDALTCRTRVAPGDRVVVTVGDSASGALESAREGLAGMGVEMEVR